MQVDYKMLRKMHPLEFLNMVKNDFDKLSYMWALRGCDYERLTTHKAIFTGFIRLNLKEVQVNIHTFEDAIINYNPKVIAEKLTIEREIAKELKVYTHYMIHISTALELIHRFEKDITSHVISLYVMTRYGAPQYKIENELVRLREKLTEVLEIGEN